MKKYINAAAFISSQAKIGNVSIDASLRYDLNDISVSDNYLVNGDHSGSKSYNSINPAIGINVKLFEGFNLYSGFRTSFETPVLNEFSNNPNSGEGFNGLLLPQTSHNIDLGFRYNWKSKLTVDAAAFVIKSTNELVPFEVQDFPGKTFYRNTGKTNRLGIEMRD